MSAINTIRNKQTPEQGLLLAGVLALLVHVVFIIVMIFGLNWKTQSPEGMVIDLWQDLSRPVQPHKIPEPSLPPKQQTKPVEEPVKQEPAAESIRMAPPPPKKPDIPLKQENKKPKPEQKIKSDSEDIKKKAQERRDAEKKAKEKAEAERLQHEQEAHAKLEAQQAAARARVMSEVAKYKAMILAKIRSRIVMPPDLPGNPVAEFNVTLLPGGDILDARLRRGSGYTAFDAAVERAIILSRPLPLPPDPALFNEFRSLNVTVHYLE
ncbi:MAG: cell envelope integrity protein TolA [Nitrosomonas sp.]|nr:cell envelope integrity protein TolA [Nitrosomonas sp.]